MKCIVIYFSQTGNTEKIARAIQSGIEQAAGECELAKIKDINPRRLGQYDLIGLGCPILGFAEPVNVAAFIKEMRFIGGKHVFPFATHGTRPEFFFPSIVTKLKRRNLVVIGMYNCYANVFMPGMPEPYPTAGHPDEVDIREATAFGKEMVERSKRISAGETELIPPLPTWVEYDVDDYANKRELREKELGVPAISAEKRKFKAMYKLNKDKCMYPACRVCMDACPMDGIDVTIDPPVVAKPCMMCNTCVKVCPTGALKSERPPRAETPVAARKAVFEEFYLAPLAKAEAEGRFRRIVPLEKITFK